MKTLCDYRGGDSLKLNPTHQSLISPLSIQGDVRSGSRLIHLPLVKSGTATGALPMAIESSDRLVMLIQAAQS